MAKKKQQEVSSRKQTLAEKLSLIDKISAEINAKAGKTIVGRIGKDEELMDKLTIKFIPSSCRDFNTATGGGYPRSRCTLIAGLPDSGKTSRLLEDIGYNMQKNPEFTTTWIETEKSLDKKMICDVFGIDPERFVFIEYDADQGAEGVLNLLYGFMTAVQFDMVVINSLKCLVPTKILEEEMEAQTPAVQARLWSKMVSKFLALTANNETAFVLITHLYTGIGTYGSPMVVAGGNAIRYWSSLTLSFNKKTIGQGEPIEKDEGIHVEVTIKKNHCVADRLPYKKFDYYAIFGYGTEQILTTIKPLSDAGIISASGAFITIFDEQGTKVKTLQGKKEYRKYMSENPDIFEALIERLDSKASTITEVSEEELTEIEQEEAILDPLLQIPQKE